MEKKEIIDQECIAILFALVAKEAIVKFNDAGKDAILSAVSQFGQARGRRMMEKAQANGYPPNFVSFLVYRDLKLSAGHRIRMIKRTPHIEIMVTKCGWCDVWEREKLTEFGKLYCQGIDTAIMKGFNPESRFKVNSQLTDGKSKCCHFIYRDETFKLMDIIKLFFVKRKAKKRHGNLISPFYFHLSELLRILNAELEGRLGAEGRALIETAKEKYNEKYGYTVPEYTKEIQHPFTSMA